MKKRCREKGPKQLSLHLSRTRLEVVLPHSSTTTRALRQDITFSNTIILWFFTVLLLPMVLPIMLTSTFNRPVTRTTTKRCWVWILFTALTTHGLAREDNCEPKQYLEIGKTGIIQCSFDPGTYVIMWYNTTNSLSERPIVVLQDSTKSGYGYSSQEYDIFVNGSLVVKNVTIHHEITFTVKVLESPYSSALYTYIEIQTVVTPLHPRPIISPAAEGDGFGYLMLPEFSQLSCLITGARPMVGIEWMYGETSELIPSQTSNISEDIFNLTYTSQKRIIYPTERSPSLSLLKCQADDSAGLLEEANSLILIEKRNKDLYHHIPVVTSVKLHAELSLDCLDRSGDLVVWKKENTITKQFELVVFAELQRYNLKRVFSDDFDLSSSASLSVPRAEIKHEGHYLCISNNGIRGYQVIVAVTPTPPYLIVPGCGHQQYCVIDVQRQGNLTCKVQGLRPPVQLEFVATRGKTQITFRNIDSTVEVKGDGFDVTHTAGYIADLSLEKVTIECREKEPKQSSLDLSRTRLDLFFPDSSTTTNGFKEEDTFHWMVMPWFSAVLFLQIVTLLAILIRFVYKCGK